VGERWKQSVISMGVNTSSKTGRREGGEKGRRQKWVCRDKREREREREKDVQVDFKNMQENISPLPPSLPPSLLTRARSECVWSGSSAGIAPEPASRSRPPTGEEGREEQAMRKE